MTYTIFLSLEPYLAQWLAHQCGGSHPITLKRGSAECDILMQHLQLQPKGKDYLPQVKPLPGQVEIVLPFFKHKDIRSYNYLPSKGQRALHECIRNRFLVALWRDIQTVGNITKRTDKTIEEWMIENGIEPDDRNWNTIAKILQRKRAVYCENGRLSNRKSSKHKKRTPSLS